MIVGTDCKSALSGFLLSFMELTEIYKNEIKNINWQELQKLINELYKSGQVNDIE